MAQTSNNTTGTLPTPLPTSVQAGDKVTAQNLRQMVSLVESMIGHTHTWTDTYGENCQCNCSRGSL